MRRAASAGASSSSRCSSIQKSEPSLGPSVSSNSPISIASVIRSASSLVSDNQAIRRRQRRHCSQFSRRGRTSAATRAGHCFATIASSIRAVSALSGSPSHISHRPSLSAASNHPGRLSSVTSLDPMGVPFQTRCSRAAQSSGAGSIWRSTPAATALRWKRMSSQPSSSTTTEMNRCRSVAARCSSTWRVCARRNRCWPEPTKKSLKLSPAATNPRAKRKSKYDSWKNWYVSPS